MRDQRRREGDPGARGGAPAACVTARKLLPSLSAEQPRSTLVTAERALEFESAKRLSFWYAPSRNEGESSRCLLVQRPVAQWIDAVFLGACPEPIPQSGRSAAASISHPAPLASTWITSVERPSLTSIAPWTAARSILRSATTSETGNPNVYARTSEPLARERWSSRSRSLARQGIRQRLWNPSPAGRPCCHALPRAQGADECQIDHKSGLDTGDIPRDNRCTIRRQVIANAALDCPYVRRVEILRERERENPGLRPLRRCRSSSRRPAATRARIP